MSPTLTRSVVLLVVSSSLICLIRSSLLEPPKGISLLLMKLMTPVDSQVAAYEDGQLELYGFS